MSSERILLVDDEPSILQFARLYLERENSWVVSIMDGEAALDAKEIVEAHGGKISVHSAINTGSTFTVNLPLEMPPASPGTR